MNGNIALSMEIGSAYALQVCLLQVPCLVLFSAIYGRFIDPDDIIDHTFCKQFSTQANYYNWLTIFLSPSLPSMGYGDCYPLRHPTHLYVWRG